MNTLLADLPIVGSPSLSDAAWERAHQRLEQFHRFQDLGLIVQGGDFHPSVHYPPITMYKPITEEEMFRGYEAPADGLFDAYVHIPFCKQRCVFCHYPVVLGDKKGPEMDQYLTSLEREMDLYLSRIGVDKLRVRSVLVGGGTPSYLDPDRLRRFLDFFCARLDLSDCSQFNWDVDPSTLVGEVGLERLRIMKEYGSDRLTLGVQSLDDEVLRVMNRPHDAAGAIEAIRNCQEHGYQVNIEFIFGHPGETIDNWIDVMERAVTLDVEEIQLYRLKVESYGDHQGAVKKYIERFPDRVPSHDEAILMKQLAIEILDANGYRENLRRVFTREREHYSLYAHNQCCNLYDEVGFGQTAFSSLRDRFVLNTPDFGEYHQAIAEGRLPLNRGLVRDEDQQLRWAIVLPLKNRDVWKPTFERATGRSFDGIFRPKIERLLAHGLVEESGESLWLSPLGAFFADEVCHQFHAPEHIPYPRDSYAEGPLNPYLDTEPWPAAS